ncbi:MAG: PEP-CTERM sorting domain-containing protein [Armatimonadetes bacterium]|nr:PEP-CTERM sorting domain-containing protein [Armatimonadota bacterium]
MKRTFWSATAVVVALSVVPAVAQAQFTFTFDEWGNGFFTLPDGSQYNVKGYLAADPTGGIAGPVLIYDMPELLVPGDIAFTEPPSNDYSDAFRFFNDAVTAHLIFYSDQDPIDAPADTGLPVNLNPVFVLPEVGREGYNWCIYDTGLGFRYEGLSDGVLPEPTSMAALGLGILALARRRKAAR